MSIVINVIITLAMLYWPVVLMMSPMLFDAPGSQNNGEKVLSAFVFLSYPAIIFLLLGVFGGKYFGLNPYIFAVVSAFIILFSLTLFGYTEMMLNAIRGIPNSGYGVVKYKVYYNGGRIPDADPATFKAFKREDYQHDYSADAYAIDKNHFYYHGRSLPEVSVDNLRGEFVANDLYWLNNQYVIKWGEILENRDANTFGGYENRPHWTYAKDGEQYKLYYNDQLVEEADYNTFNPLSDPFAKDSNTVFYRNNPIELKTDVHSFETLPIYGFARDKDSVYYFSQDYGQSDKNVSSQKIEGADPTTFEKIDGRYYKDQHKVYYRNDEEKIQIVKQAHPDDFQLVDYPESKNYDAKDSQQCYQDGKVFHCDNPQALSTD